MPGSPACNSRTDTQLPQIFRRGACDPDRSVAALKQAGARSNINSLKGLICCKTDDRDQPRAIMAKTSRWQARSKLSTAASKFGHGHSQQEPWSDGTLDRWEIWFQPAP
jgi:hypothetical protein